MELRILKKKKRIEVIRILKLIYECFLLAGFEGILFGLKLVYVSFLKQTLLPH